MAVFVENRASGKEIFISSLCAIMYGALLEIELRMIASPPDF
jgi:hypothetical protein